MNPNASTTHCITTTIVKDGFHYATKRTVKLLMAFSEKCKLISSDWLVACVIEQRVVDEEEFLVRGIMLGSKLIKFKSLEVNDKIFNNIKFWVEEKDNEAITYRKVIKLIENCGGVVAKPNKGVLFVSMNERQFTECNGPIVTYRYILDSLSFQTQLRIENYLLN